MFYYNNELIRNIKNKLLKIGFSQNSIPSGLRRLNQFKKIFNEKEFNYIQLFLMTFKNSNHFMFFWLVLNNKLKLFLENKINCKICGAPVKYISFKEGFKKTCSSECLRKYKKQAFNRALEKYKEKNDLNLNVKNFSQIPKIKEKRSQWFKSQEFKEKSKQTMLKKYNIDNLFKSKEFQQEIKKVFLKKYGVDNPMKAEEIKIKTIRKLRQKKLSKKLEIAKVLNIDFNIDDYLKNKEFTITCLKCKSKFKSTKLIQCPDCNTFHITIPHEKIKQFLQNELKISFRNNKRFNIDNKVYELDIFIPEYNLGIEINGVYWHSDRFRDKNHNFRKKEAFLKKGINVLFFWDIDINNPLKFEIIKDIIKSKLNLNIKIHARDCEFKKLEYSDVENFLIQNHIQGTIKSKFNYGLFHKNELVSVMTFGATRFKKNKELELLRYCNKLGLNIIGGASKLFKNALIDLKRNLKINKSITFGDYDFVSKENNIYKVLGFNYLNYTLSFFYSKNNKRIHRYLLQKHKLKKLDEFKYIYNESLTADEILSMKNYLKCYTCGQLKFEYKI